MPPFSLLYSSKLPQFWEVGPLTVLKYEWNHPLETQAFRDGTSLFFLLAWCSSIHSVAFSEIRSMAWEASCSCSCCCRKTLLEPVSYWIRDWSGATGKGLLGRDGWVGTITSRRKKGRKRWLCRCYLISVLSSHFAMMLDWWLLQQPPTGGLGKARIFCFP